MAIPNSQPDPLEQVMAVVVEGFKKTTEAIQSLRDQQAELAEQQKQYTKAAYHGMTGSGKSRFVSELVAIERAKDPRGAQSRVADLIEVSEGRISQLLNSDKNRKNGK